MNYKDKSTIVSTEFYARVAMISGYSKEIVRDVFQAAFEFVEDEMKSGTPVTMGKLGVFTRQERKVGAGYNFHTKEKLGMKTTSLVKFIPSKQLKEAAKFQY